MARPSAVAVAFAVAAVAGCAGGPAGPTLPPRPQELRLEGVDLCRLLTDEEQRRLGLNSVSRSDTKPICDFAHFPGEPKEAYNVGAYLGEGAAPALQAPGSREITIAGFGAVEARAATGDPERSCFVYVDVAEGQHLRLLYTYDGDQLPMNRATACEKARSVAELMVANLRAQRR